MTLNLIRTQHGFMPAFDDDVNAAKKVPIGEMIATEWKPSRNPKFHRKLFALLNAVLPNQEYHSTINNLLEEIKFKAGYYKTFITSTGEKFLKVDSIAFSEMDNAEFEKFFNKAHEVCCELVGDDAIEEIMRFI